MPPVVARNGLVRHGLGLINTEYDFRHKKSLLSSALSKPVWPVWPAGSGIEGGSAQTEVPFRAQNAQNDVLQPATTNLSPCVPVGMVAGYCAPPLGLVPVPPLLMHVVRL